MKGEECMLSERIKELRLSRNLNQVQLGEALWVTKQTISNWENDNIQPSIAMLIKIAKYFKVSTDYLLGLDNNKYINVSNLTETQIAHIQLIIDDIAQK